MTMFHLVASIFAISNSITDLILLDAPSILAHELVEPTVDVAALLVLALGTIVAFVASSFRRDALPVVAGVLVPAAGGEEDGYGRGSVAVPTTVLHQPEVHHIKAQEQGLQSGGTRANL